MHRMQIWLISYSTSIIFGQPGAFTERDEEESKTYNTTWHLV